MGCSESGFGGAAGAGGPGRSVCSSAVCMTGWDACQTFHWNVESGLIRMKNCCSKEQREEEKLCAVVYRALHAGSSKVGGG